MSHTSRYLFNQGDGYLPFAVKEDGKWKPAFTTNGEEMQVTGNASETRPMYSKLLKAGDNEVTITGLKPGKDGFIWMTAIDRAGNISGNCQMVLFQTTKSVPEITTLPEVSGVYGDAANTLRVTKTGVAEYQGEVIPGSWEVTGAGNELLKTGSTQKYQVTFTPDASYADIYESTTVEVTPTISKRPLKINVANSEKSYGAGLPDITFSLGESLVEGDTVDEIKDTLTMKTEATKDSDVGEYPFTVVSDSKKYEVTALYYNDLDHLDEETPQSEGTLWINKGDMEVTVLEKSYPYNLNTEEKYDIVKENKLDLARIGELAYGDIDVKINGDDTIKLTIRRSDKKVIKPTTESEVKKSNSAKTGDASNPLGMMAVTVCSLFAIGLVLRNSKKKHL